MLYFLALQGVAYPDTLEPIVSMGELLTYAELCARFMGEHGMDNLITHVISAPNREEALKIVSALAEQI